MLQNFHSNWSANPEVDEVECYNMMKEEILIQMIINVWSK